VNRNEEYGNKKQYFWNLVGILHMSLQLVAVLGAASHGLWHNVLTCLGVFGSGLHIKKDFLALNAEISFFKVKA
jgi:hypothetical protein